MYIQDSGFTTHDKCSMSIMVPIQQLIVTDVTINFMPQPTGCYIRSVDIQYMVGNGMRLNIQNFHMLSGTRI